MRGEDGSDARAAYCAGSCRYFEDVEPITTRSAQEVESKSRRRACKHHDREVDIYFEEQVQESARISDGEVGHAAC